MWKKFCGVVLAALIVIGLFGPVPVAAAQGESGAGKIINVVYDDSRSMYLNNETRWCQAKYAMEVFCAMMGENDVMNIFAMNRPEILTIYGGDATRVEQVHAMTSKYSGTPFSTVTKAGNALLKESSSQERWLVVLTDGSFDNTSKQTVQDTLDDYNEQGIKTIYLAIGNDAVELSGDPSRDAYAEKAATTSEILTKVTKIANQIFEHQVLGNKFISEAGGVVTLNIDIPTEQIVVFVQGEGAAVGAMSLNGKNLAADSSQSVRHSGDVMPLNDEEIQVDTSLYGVVTTFEAGDTPFESGKFSLTVSNATNVEFYYRPGVTTNCELLYGGRAVQYGDELYAGDYEVELDFINPLTGEVVKSELLSEAEFTLTVTNNGWQQVVSSDAGTVVLEEGDVDIYAVAELPGDVRLSSLRSYTVLPEPVELTLSFEAASFSYTPGQMGENGNAIIMSAVNAETGEAITEEEWNSVDIQIDEAGGVTWLVTKGAEIGTWVLRPVSRDGSLAGVELGEHSFGVTATYQIDKQYAFGYSTIPLSIGEYTGNGLRVTIDPPAGDYDLNGMDEPEGMLVTVLYEDPQTGEYLPLTDELWRTLELDVQCRERIRWDLTRGKETGTWVLTPGYYAGDPAMTDSGVIPVTILAEGTQGEYLYSGSGERDVEFIPLSTANLIKILAPRVIAALFALWLIIGYIKKKRLRIRGLNPRCHFRGTDSPRQKISKDFFSVILPYVPEKATVRCHKSAFQCNFPDLRIQAAGRRSFKIINKTIPFKTTKICGEFYSDMETLKKRTFSFGSFDITSVNPKANNRSLGTFTFN